MKDKTKTIKSDTVFLKTCIKENAAKIEALAKKEEEEKKQKDAESVIVKEVLTEHKEEPKKKDKKKKKKEAEEAKAAELAWQANSNVKPDPIKETLPAPENLKESLLDIQGDTGVEEGEPAVKKVKKVKNKAKKTCFCC